jgi:hypothetical protein
MGPLFTGDVPVLLDVDLDPDQRQLVAKVIGDMPPADWLRGVILRAALWQVAVRELREGDPQRHDWTSENLPTCLVEILDAQAGKLHSPGGAVRRCLADILNVYDGMMIYDDGVAEAHEEMWRGSLSTSEFVDAKARRP